MSIWHCPFSLFWFLILLYITFPFSLPLPTFYSPLLFPILQHIYLVVLCCVSEDKADVLLYNEVCIHVNEMVKSTKGSMFIIVFINIRSYVPGIKAGRGLQLWQITSFKKLNFMLMWAVTWSIRFVCWWASPDSVPFLLVNSLLVPCWRRERHLSDNMKS